jgi:hypothetical protein
MAVLLDYLVDEYLGDRRDTNMLDVSVLGAQAIKAVRFYHGYSELSAYMGSDAEPIIALSTPISDSEWSVIRPLFELYAEKETSIQLEASRALGVDVFGRATSEISQDIKELEADMPSRAFCRDIVTI